jgi:putative intracellular protease/amidase
VVPGGFADRVLDENNAVVQFVKRIHPTTQWTTSVCTGSIFLAHAGILNGLAATTHWGSYDRLNALGAVATSQRVVQVGKVIWQSNTTLSRRLIPDQSQRPLLN